MCICTHTNRFANGESDFEPMNWVYTSAIFGWNIAPFLAWTIRLCPFVLCPLMDIWSPCERSYLCRYAPAEPMDKGEFHKTSYPCWRKKLAFSLEFIHVQSCQGLHIRICKYFYILYIHYIHTYRWIEIEFNEWQKRSTVHFIYRLVPGQSLIGVDRYLFLKSVFSFLSFSFLDNKKNTFFLGFQFQWL